MNTIPLRSLTYVSQATAPLDEAGLHAIAAIAARLNALDGITGLLVYNGSSFCQTIEGGETAIDDLMARLHRDPRHTNLAVLADERIAKRRFGSWNMRMLSLPETKPAALDALAAELAGLDSSARTTLRATVAGAYS